MRVVGAETRTKRLVDVAAIVLTSSMEPQWLNAIFAAGVMEAISKSIPPLAIAALARPSVERVPQAGRGKSHRSQPLRPRVNGLVGEPWAVS